MSYIKFIDNGKRRVMLPCYATGKTCAEGSIVSFYMFIDEYGLIGINCFFESLDRIARSEIMMGERDSPWWLLGLGQSFLERARKKGLKPNIPNPWTNVELRLGLLKADEIHREQRELPSLEMMASGLYQRINPTVINPTAEKEYVPEEVTRLEAQYFENYLKLVLQKEISEYEHNQPRFRAILNSLTRWTPSYSQHMERILQQGKLYSIAQEREWFEMVKSSKPLPKAFYVIARSVCEEKGGTTISGEWLNVLDARRKERLNGFIDNPYNSACLKRNITEYYSITSRETAAYVIPGESIRIGYVVEKKDIPPEWKRISIGPGL